MSILDVDSLLQEVSPELPCGEDLEYDPMFVEMEEAAQGTPERQSGDTIIPAEEPNWHEVRNKALELLLRTKDLRVTVYLIRALVPTSGLIGLHDGLLLLRGLIERYWEPIHPQLDPDDDYDPTLRVNTLSALCDPETTLHSIRETPLVSSRNVGRFTLRDLEIATGRLTVPRGADEEPPPQLAVIDAAFMDCNPEELQATTSAVAGSMDHVRTVEALVTEQLGAAQAPNLSPLVALLKEIHQILAERLSRRGLAESSAVETEESETASQADEIAGTTMEGTASVARSPKPMAGEINSRQDVIRMLDKICEYYQRSEPSSPVPLLLVRARRLVSMDFIEILRDLAPDSVSHVEALRGAGGGSEGSDQ